MESKDQRDNNDNCCRKRGTADDPPHWLGDLGYGTLEFGPRIVSFGLFLLKKKLCLPSFGRIGAQINVSKTATLPFGDSISPGGRSCTKQFHNTGARFPFRRGFAVVTRLGIHQVDTLIYFLKVLLLEQSLSA